MKVIALLLSLLRVVCEQHLMEASPYPLGLFWGQKGAFCRGGLFGASSQSDPQVKRAEPGVDCPEWQCRMCEGTWHLSLGVIK